MLQGTISHLCLVILRHRDTGWKSLSTYQPLNGNTMMLQVCLVLIMKVHFVVVCARLCLSVCVCLCSFFLFFFWGGLVLFSAVHDLFSYFVVVVVLFVCLFVFGGGGMHTAVIN